LPSRPTANCSGSEPVGIFRRNFFCFRSMTPMPSAVRSPIFASSSGKIGFPLPSSFGGPRFGVPLSAT
jgi:hypothetical protein